MTADPASPLTELLRLPAGPVDLADLDPAATPGFPGKKADAPGRHRGPGPGARRPAGAAVRGRPDGGGRAPEDPDRAAGHGHLRQGRGDPARDRPGRSAGRQDQGLQGADRGGAAAPLPVADRARAAAAGHDRHLRPVAVRGRAGRPGERAGAEGGVAGALRRDQRLGAAAGRRRHGDRQVLPAHLLRRAEGAAAGPARRPDQALEVQPGRRRRRGRSGPTTRPPTPTPWSGAAPRSRRGT